MTRRFSRLAWSAATCTYLLIILGAIVRITGSGMGCGDDWPLCKGRLLPPLELHAIIEFAHRQLGVLVSVLVVALAAYAWMLRSRSGTDDAPDRSAFVALGLLGFQVAIGAVTVKLRLPPWTVVLHLGTAMLVLATLLVSAKRTGPPCPPGLRPGSVPGLAALGLGFLTVLLGALTANLGAASACLGFPLCNGQLVPVGDYLQYVHWTHRVLAYTLFGYVVWWAVHTKRHGAWYVVALIAVQVTIAGAMVLLTLPEALRAAHVAVGTAIWAALVLAVL
jgi:heme A synthase